MDNHVQSRRRFLKAAGLAAGLTVAGCYPVDSRRDTSVGPGESPNILWITCEDTSPYLGCYGDEQAITPNLDRLAEESLVYTKAFATAPVCAPARSCLITGVYATSLGTQHLRSTVPLPKQIKPFPRYLREAGYYCTNNYKKDYNFIDVDVWDESSETAHWRSRKAGQPFFAVFNLMSTHQGQINGTDDEFNAKYRSKLDPEERHDPDALTLPLYYPDTPMVRNIWARYYDLITFMDKQVAQLLGQLEQDELAEDTVVFFFSDHGMGLPRFKRTLYDSGLHVPLMVRFPKRWRHLAPAGPGERVDELVSFIDFPPTLLGLAGLPIPQYMQGRTFLGPRAGPEPKYVYGASSRVDEVYEMSRSVRDRRYKYIRNYLPHLGYIQPSEYPDRAEIMQELRRVVASGRLNETQAMFWQQRKPIEELYDTQADPHELSNLANSPQHKPILGRLKKALRKWMIETRDVGLLSEAEMHIRSTSSTPYELAHDRSKYAVRRILASAELVGAGPDKLDAMVKALEDSDSGVRYWAAIALTALSAEAAPATEALKRALHDESPNVRFAAAGALCKLGRCDQAMDVLAKGLEDPRETVALYAAREIQWAGKQACRIKAQIEQKRASCRLPDGSYKNQDHAAFIDWALKYALDNCKEQAADLAS